MKAEIDQKGILEIASETQLESYALQCWVDANKDKINCQKLIISLSAIVPEKTESE